MRPSANLRSGSKALAPGFPYLLWLTPVFFLLFCFYSCWRLQPAAVYAYSNQVFFLRRDFFLPFVKRPGGLVEYGAAFLGTLSYYNWLGALVWTLFGISLFLAAAAILRGRLALLSPGLFVPPLLFLLLLERYNAAAMTCVAGLLPALGIFLGYARLFPNRAWLRLPVCLIAGVVLFYLAGTWPCLLFGVLAGVSEALVLRRWWLSLGCLLAVILAPLCALAFRVSTPGDSFLPWHPHTSLVLAGLLYLAFPLMLGARALLPATSPTEEEPQAARRHGSKPAHGKLRSLGFEAALGTAVICAGWAVVWLAFDSHGQALAEVEYCSEQGRDEQVLSAAAGLKRMNPTVEIRLQRALYHTGRLCQDLFSFTNQEVWELLPNLGQGLECCQAQAETLLELGQVSEAEHQAHEALEWVGNRPETLRLLAEVNVLKNRPQAARVFLNLLQEVPFQGRWAERSLRELEGDPRWTNNVELTAIRARMVNTDYIHADIPTEVFMLQLLHANPHNRMAFEYLLAHYLLNRQLDKLTGKLKDLEAFGFTSVPRHCEEAVLLYEGLKHTKVDLGRLTINARTTERFEQFRNALNQGATKSPEGQRALNRDFADTFWYYYFTRPADAGQGPNSSG